MQSLYLIRESALAYNKAIEFNDNTAMLQTKELGKKMLKKFTPYRLDSSSNDDVRIYQLAFSQLRSELEGSGFNINEKTTVWQFYSNWVYHTKKK